jgi:phenylacetate-CoA ligase
MLMRFYDSVIKQRRSWEYFEEMRRFKTGTREVTQARLANILRHAARTVPFYKGLIGPNFKDECAFDILSELPIITKKDLNTRPELFKSSKPGEGVYGNSTGGSTGQPLQVLQDNAYFDSAQGTKYLFYEWSGWNPGEKILKIWGSQKDVLGQTETFKSRLSSSLRKMRVLDAFKISSQDVRKYVAEIESYRPAILECYVDAAYTVAKEMIRQGIRLSHQVKGVLVSAGTLYPEFETVIKEAFRAPVVNRYGSREAGDIACTCPSGRIHVNPFTHYVEIVDKDGNRIQEGTGRVILTLLTNKTMPLIRYEIGDLATIERQDTQCPCGRDWQTLERVDGRMGSLFYKKDGTAISPLFFVHFVGVVHNSGLFEKYQIIQEDSERILVKLVLAEGVKPLGDAVQHSLEKIRTDFGQVLGQETEITFSFEEDISPLASGKYVYAFSKIEGLDLRKGHFLK